MTAKLGNPRPQDQTLLQTFQRTPPILLLVKLDGHVRSLVLSFHITVSNAWVESLSRLRPPQALYDRGKFQVELVNVAAPIR
jgi:hypothetical protein